MILENVVAPLAPRIPMFGLRPPFRYRLLVTPKRERRQFVGVGEALKALSGNESILLFQQGPDVCGDVEMLLLAHFGDDDLKISAIVEKSSSGARPLRSMNSVERPQSANSRSTDERSF
jgi:hypothetical protein